MLRQFNSFEYSGVRILDSLLATLERLNVIYPTQIACRFLDSRRYQLEHLKTKSHIQLLRAIFELQELIQAYPKMCRLNML